MVDNMKENGKIIPCMAKVFTFGKMGENMMANINMIKNTVSESISALMERSIRKLIKRIYFRYEGNWSNGL